MYGITGQEMQNIRLQQAEMEKLNSRIGHLEEQTRCFMHKMEILHGNIKPLQIQIDSIIDTLEVLQTDLMNKFTQIETKYNVIVDLLVRMNNLKGNESGI